MAAADFSSASAGGCSSPPLPVGGDDGSSAPVCAEDPSETGPAGRSARAAASLAATALCSAASAARRACWAASIAISPTSRTPSSEARAITTASSIRASSWLTVGTTPRGTIQSWVLSRSDPSIAGNLWVAEAANRHAQ